MLKLHLILGNTIKKSKVVPGTKYGCLAVFFSQRGLFYINYFFKRWILRKRWTSRCSTCTRSARARTTRTWVIFSKVNTWTSKWTRAKSLATWLRKWSERARALASTCSTKNSNRKRSLRGDLFYFLSVRLIYLEEEEKTKKKNKFRISYFFE